MFFFSLFCEITIAIMCSGCVQTENGFILVIVILQKITIDCDVKFVLQSRIEPLFGFSVNTVTNSRTPFHYKQRKSKNFYSKLKEKINNNSCNRFFFFQTQIQHIMYLFYYFYSKTNIFSSYFLFYIKTNWKRLLTCTLSQELSTLRCKSRLLLLVSTPPAPAFTCRKKIQQNKIQHT